MPARERFGGLWSDELVRMARHLPAGFDRRRVTTTNLLEALDEQIPTERIPDVVPLDDPNHRSAPMHYPMRRAGRRRDPPTPLDHGATSEAWHWLLSNIPFFDGL